MKDLRDVNFKNKKPLESEQQLTVTVIVAWTLLSVAGIGLMIWLG